MFEQMAKELVSHFPDKAKDFYITQEEYENFCKEFLFEELKGNTKLGEAFCEKFKQTNYVLSILSNKSAREHIKTFYVK
jgi:hypothetical protein